MGFQVIGSGEVPNPTRPEQWAPWEPSLPPGVANNFETGRWLMQVRLRRSEEQEFNFLLQFLYLIRDEICDLIFPLWEEKQVRNAFHHVWNATPFPKEKTREAVAGPSATHFAVPGQDAEAELGAAVQEGILEAAKQATLEINTKGAPKVDSWLKSTNLCSSAACPAPAGH